MATNIVNNQAFVTGATYNALIDILCPAGESLILSYDLGDDYADKLEAAFPGTRWDRSESGKTTVILADSLEANGGLFFRLIDDSDPTNNSPVTMWYRTVGSGSDGKQLKYGNGLKLTGTQNLYKYTRLT